jgi:hypothetical protein
MSYAVVSCSNWGFGYFNVYNMMANIDALDAWVHVGDNYYEHKDLLLPPTVVIEVRPFVTDPPTEIVTLDDYRRRMRLYRLDPDLQLLGSRVPFIALTDDHDYTNNAWMTTAENHQTGGSPNLQGGNPTGAGFDTTPYPEGDYYVRISNALAAWFSYMPIREGAQVYSGTGNVGNVATDFTTVNAAATAQFPGPYWNSVTNTPTANCYTPLGLGLNSQVQAVPGLSGAECDCAHALADVHAAALLPRTLAWLPSP